MASDILGNPLVNEQTETSEPVFGFRDSVRAARQNLRSFGIQVIAFLLGIALACM